MFGKLQYVHVEAISSLRMKKELKCINGSKNVNKLISNINQIKILFFSFIFNFFKKKNALTH